MTLLTTMYDEANDVRLEEIRKALRLNSQNDLIEKIVVFVEEETSPEALPKVEAIRTSKRTMFCDFFEYANSCLSGPVIIANSDIYFDDTLKALDGYDYENKFISLSRWDLLDDGTLRFIGSVSNSSQDAWIFKPPIAKFTSDFGLGLPGCDNRILFEASAAGLSVSNPSLSVKACHIHGSGVRHYTGRVSGPSLWLSGHEL